MSEATFNLLDRGWIPVTLIPDGSYHEFSIREAFDRADEIRDIKGDFSIQSFALTRLLVAFLYGTFGDDMEVETWNLLLDGGPHNSRVSSKLHEYFDKYQDRFDLFDEKQPFYQVADLRTKKNEVSGLEKLILDVPNGEPYFTVRGGSGIEKISAATAARWLVTVQAFDPSGIKSGAVGDPRVKGGKGYPIGAAWCGNLGGLVVEGKNLWETLVLNYTSEEVFNFGDAAVEWDSEDMPMWQRPQLTESPVEGFNQVQESVGDTQFFHGPATLLTWQSRRVRLIHDGETVTGVIVSNGDRLKPQNAYAFETMSAWRRSQTQEKALKKPLVYMPRKHNAARALWRGLPNFTTAEKATTSDKPADFRRPLSMEWLNKTGAKDRPIRLHAYSVEYGNQEAVVDSVIDEQLDMNLIVLTSDGREIKEILEKAISLVEQGVGALRNLASDIARAAGTDTAGPRQTIGETAYSAFDSVFRQWVVKIKSGFDYDAVSDEWSRIAKKLLLDIGIEYLSHAPTQAIVGTMVHDEATQKTVYNSAARADIRFRGALNKIFPATVESER